MEKKYRVTLTEEERAELGRLVSVGKTAARRLNHARILLMADASAQGLGRTDEQIVEALNVGTRTVERVRQRFVEEGFEAALTPRPRPRMPHKLKENLKQDVARSQRATRPRVQAVDTAALGWQSRRIEGAREDFARERAAGAKKNGLKPWLEKTWCIPPKRDADFVCRMEDVLELYRLP